MKTFEQISQDYQLIMNGYNQPQNCYDGQQLNPHVYFEEFSVYDKNLQSTSISSIMCL